MKKVFESGYRAEYPGAEDVMAIAVYRLSEEEHERAWQLWLEYDGEEWRKAMEAWLGLHSDEGAIMPGAKHTTYYFTLRGAWIIAEEHVAHNI